MQIRQVRALVAPTRQEIIDALGVLGTASVAELAALLGRAPDSLYHHLRVLQGVELVHRDERERDGGGREAVYSLP